MLETLLEQLHKGGISQRSFVGQVKGKDQTLLHEVEAATSFLDSYNPSIVERIYSVINGLKEVQICPYCGKKRKFTERLNDGYKNTCCSNECTSKERSEWMTGTTKISENRGEKFIEWQASIGPNQVIDDAFIKEHFKYDKYVDMTTSPAILSYIDKRYNDSDSRLETVQRIRFGIEKKPLCPTCGRPVTWVGKQTKLYTYYCSDTCRAKNEQTHQKMKDTMMEKYGAKSCYDSSIYQEQYMEKYGVGYTWQRADVRAKRKETMIKKYGVDEPLHNREIAKKHRERMNSPEVRTKIQTTLYEHYGVSCPFNMPGIQEKSMKRRLEVGAGTSIEEQTILGWLRELGYTVKDHYSSSVYPYQCDYYIEDYDMYVEYQGSHFHNNRAYFGTSDDLADIERYKEKGEIKKQEGKNSQYFQMIDTWAVRDVDKRQVAYDNNVNLLELYSAKSKEDVQNQIEFVMACRRGENPYCCTDKQLNASYEYLKRLVIDEFDDITTSMPCINIIKHFQGQNFYKKELEIYGYDHIKRRKLIQNRMQYKKLKESDLTPDILIGGFKPSGIYYGYSHFNIQLTNWFVRHFSVQTVYDPCGGWGHHMLGMLNCKKIIYNDFSKSTVEGIQQMKDYYGIDQLEVHYGDALTYIPEDVDAFFMCPPYYNKEKYECGEFANEPEYAAFLNRIFDIWMMNNASIFGVVLRDDFYKHIEDKYKELIIECHKVNVNTNHFLSASSTKGKTHFEYFYIFKK